MKYLYTLLLFVFPFKTSAMIIGVSGHTDYIKNVDQYVSILEKYKISSFRTDYTWGLTEKKKGEFDFISYKTDQVVMRAHKKGIRPLLILDYGNKAYGFDRPLNQMQLHQYCNYVKNVAERYKETGVIYEIWNEWSHPSKNYKNSQSSESAEDYVKLVKCASYEIKKIDNSALVLAGGFNPVSSSDTEWARFIISKGINKFVDGISIHPYSYTSKKASNPLNIIKKIDNVHDYLQKKVVDMKKINFYITEFGYPTDNSRDGFNELNISDNLNVFLNQIKHRSYIKGFWWYDLKDDGMDKKNTENNFGLLRHNLEEKQAMSTLEKYNLN